VNFIEPDHYVDVNDRDAVTVTLAARHLPNAVQVKGMRGLSLCASK
jgi:hypothetical protein